MASIISAIEETFQDNNSGIKLIAFSLPLFLALQLSFNGSEVIAAVLSIFSQMFLFGTCIRCVHNARNGKDCFLPDFNIFKTLWVAIKGEIALAPMCFGLYFLWGVIYAFFHSFTSDAIFTMVISIAIYVIFSSMIFTSFILFTHNFKIIEAYNFKLIFKYCIDFLLHLIFFALKCVFLNTLSIIPLGYIIWLFFELTSPVALFFISFIIVVNSIIISHYFAQIDYEVIETDILDNDVNF